MPRISHFDIPVDDPERAQKFYNEVFDWKFEKWNGLLDGNYRYRRAWN